MSKLKDRTASKVYISYSWSSGEHIDRVVNLANFLRRDGIDVVFDRWEVKEGQNFTEFMNRCVDDVSINKVLVICDKEYARKANALNLKGGVGYETSIISSSILNNAQKGRFIPIVFEKSTMGEAFLPTYFGMTKYIDMTPENFVNGYNLLLENLYRNEDSERMFYHVIIQFKEKLMLNNLKRFEYDHESEEEIINDILVPYVSDSKFLFDGALLKPNDIEKVEIRRTHHPIREVISSVEKDNVYLNQLSKEVVVQSEMYTKDITKSIFAKVIKSTINPTNQSDKLSIRAIDGSGTDINNSIRRGIETETTDRTKVFIVHGHDTAAKTEVARFVEKLGYTAIILHEQASNSDTIIEKIERYSNVGFAIVLYTPCDVGGKKELEPRLLSRARQNVLFEHGYLMAKIGRKNVCALVKDDVEKPNDISGIVYVTMDQNDGWKLGVVKEMVGSGYNIDYNKLNY